MYWFREAGSLRSPGVFELSWNRWGLALVIIYEGPDREHSWPWMLHFHFLLINCFIHFWAPPIKIDPNYDDQWISWGFSFHDRDLHVNWGQKWTRLFTYPWVKEQIRHEVRRPDGCWVPYVGTWEQDKVQDGREVLQYPYTYKLESSDIQHRIASVYVERRFYRPRWFKWTRLFETQAQWLEVEFNDEVGERSGSWKGGCMGCAYDIRPNETPLDALRRMERDRKF